MNKAGFASVLTLILIGFLIQGAAASKNVTEIQRKLHEAAESELTYMSTPELIQSAFEDGLISDEQRVLYLAYSIYDYALLPEQYISPTPWDGTGVVFEIKMVYQELMQNASTSDSADLKSELDRLLSPQTATCDQANQSNDTNSINFQINYGSISGLSITDYSSVLETTFATEVTSYGWAKPPLSAGNPWARYLVQVLPLSGGLYGYVTTLGPYSGFIGNNPNTVAVETQSYASCMVLNSNYTSLGGLNGLQATVAHEFVHSIQYGVGDPGWDEDDMWWESVAAYMEDEVYDASNDNYQYLWPDFNTCLGEYSGNVYSNWLFFRYIAEQNGGTNVTHGGEDSIQDLWSGIAAGSSAMPAFNTALLSKGTTLADSFHKYAIATRFMKTCPNGSPYCYEEAAGYLAAAGAISSHGFIPGTAGSYNGTISDNYGMRWIDLPVSSPISITLQNISAGSQLRGSVVAETASGLVVTSFPTIVSNGGSTSLFNFSTPAGTTRLIAVITNQTQTSNNPSVCSTGAYSLSLDTIPGKEIYLPIIANYTSMTGQVTYRGTPLIDTEVVLRYWDGFSWSTYDTALTDSNGRYSFLDHPQLTNSNEAKYIRWDNAPTYNDNYLWTHWCNEIYMDSSISDYSCNFDVEDIILNLPEPGVTKNFPITFTWTPRLQTSDSYELDIYDIGNDPDEPEYYSALLGYVNSFRIDSLNGLNSAAHIPGFSTGVDYGWDVWVIDPDGYGESYYYYEIRFGGSSQLPGKPTPRFLRSNQRTDPVIQVR